MCLTLSIEQSSDLGLLATDTRRHITTSDGIVTSDPGDKLRRIPNGFVAATGDATVGTTGLDRLEEVDARDRDAVRETVKEVYREKAPAVRQQYEDGDPENTYFFVLARDAGRVSAYRVQATGELHESRATNILIGWPFSGDAVDRHKAEFVQAIQRPGAFEDFVQRVASLFHNVSEDDQRVSGTLDLAVVTAEGQGLQTRIGPDFSGYYQLEGPARGIAAGRVSVPGQLKPAPDPTESEDLTLNAWPKGRAPKTNVNELSAIAGNVGTLTSGRIQDGSNSRGILISGSVPTGDWSRWLNLGDDTEPFLEHENLTLGQDGSAEFSGSLSAASGTFSGSLDAASGTFSGSLDAASGTFSGSLSAADGTFEGDLTASLMNAESLLLQEETGTISGIQCTISANEMYFEHTADGGHHLEFWPDGGAARIRAQGHLTLRPNWNNPDFNNRRVHINYEDSSEPAPVAGIITRTTSPDGRDSPEGTLWVQVP